LIPFPPGKILLEKYVHVISVLFCSLARRLLMYKLELTEEELLFLHDRCVSKIARLEEAHLEDIPCYRLSWQVLHKIYEARGLTNTTEEKF
jgi:hypothetical protein